MAPHLEFRPRENGEFDEMVARFKDGVVHIETLSKGSCYIGFQWDDGRYCQWYVSSKKKLHYHHESGSVLTPPRFTAQGIDTRKGGNEVPSRSDESPVAESDAPNA